MAATSDSSSCSEMPWGGKIDDHGVDRRRMSKAAIKLRIPGWARNRPAPGRSLHLRCDAAPPSAAVSVNGKRVHAPSRTRWATSRLDRIWKNGDVIEVEFPDRRPATSRRLARQSRRRPRWPSSADRSCIAPNGRTSMAAARSTLLFDAEATEAASVDAAVYDGATVIRTAGDARREPGAPAEAGDADSLLPVGQPRRGRDDGLAVDQRITQIGDVGPAGGVIFYENPELRDAMAGAISKPRRSIRARGAKWGCFRTAHRRARAARPSARASRTRRT